MSGFKDDHESIICSRNIGKAPGSTRRQRSQRVAANATKKARNKYPITAQLSIYQWVQKKWAMRAFKHKQVKDKKNRSDFCV